MRKLQQRSAKRQRHNRKSLQRNMLILFCLTLLFSPFGSAVSGLEAQENTDETVTILNVEQLDDIRNNLQGHYALGADIDMAGYDWKPIGTEDEPFTGSFHGAGKKITGMGSAYVESEHGGLFGIVSDEASVVDVVVEHEGGTKEKDDDNDADEFNKNAEEADEQTEEPKETNDNPISDDSALDEDANTVTPFGLQLMGNGDFAGGSGTADDPYLIETAEQLDKVRDHCTSHFKLIADIDLGVAPYNQGEGWEPIGKEGLYFSGTVDGNGKTISNLTINRPTEDNIGLFGFLSGGKIENVTLSAINVKGQKNVGGLVGNSTSGMTITSSKLSGEVTGTENIGGLIGNLRGTVENSKSSVRVNGTKHVGGLVGNSPTVDDKIIQSSASGDVTGTEFVGGLVGKSQSDIINGSASGAVVGSGDKIGGLVGEFSGSQAIKTFITNSDATGDVEGASYVGGLVGYARENLEIAKSSSSGNVKASGDVGGLVGNLYKGDIVESFATGQVEGKVAGGLVGRLWDTGKITNVYATGSVNGTVEAGGLIGRDQSGTIKNSYATGAVNTPTHWKGGLIGVVGNDLTINDSFYDKETSGQSDDSGKGTPKTTAEMQTQATFTNWDFDHVWDMPAGDYPRLQWEGIGGQPPVQFAGSGTVDDPYLVETAEQLDKVRDHLTSHFKIIEDIDLGIAPYNQGEGWEPIGSTPLNSFSGTLDGNGKTISNLTIARSDEENVGLFSSISGEIINVKLQNVNIRGKHYVGSLSGVTTEDSVIRQVNVVGEVRGTNFVGGLVGDHSGTIENVSIDVKVSGFGLLGGIAGEAKDGSSIKDSESSGDITGAGNLVGGLVGQGNGTIENSHATGNVKSGGKVGGLVGNLFGQGIIIASSSTGNVEGNHDYVGGLVGHLWGGKIQQSFATGDVNGTANNVGGLVGETATNSDTKNSFATGKVTGSGDNVGGLVGYHLGAMENSYSRGQVIAPNNASGGLIGDVGPVATIINSFYDEETSGQSDDTGKGTPKITAEMKSQATFTNWDFDDVWDMPAGDYPRLQWEGIGGQPPVAGGDVTVIYVDEADNEIASSETHKGNVGETYTTVEKAVVGYTFKKVIGDKTGTFTADPQEVKYVYRKDEVAVPNKEITSRHYDWVPLKTGWYDINNLPLQEKIEVPLDDGSKVELEINWNMVSDPVYDKNKEGRYLFSGEFVLIDGVTNPKGYLAQRLFVLSDVVVTVTYVDEDGNELAPEEKLTGKVGDEYTTDAKKIKGYTLIETPKNAAGKLRTVDLEVKYVYTKNPVAGGDVTAIYVDEDGNVIEEPDTRSGNIGETYTTVEKAIPGYTFKEVIGDKTGTFTAVAQEVKYVYTKDPVVVLDGVVIVIHVDGNGKELAPQEKLAGKVGAPYETAAKKIAEYAVKRIPKNASGVFRENEINVVYVYEKVKKPADPEKTPKETEVDSSKSTETNETNETIITIGSDNNTDPKVKIEADNKRVEDKQLPNTATNYFNALFLGVLLVLIGTVIYTVRRKNRVQNK